MSAAAVTPESAGASAAAAAGPERGDTSGRMPAGVSPKAAGGGGRMSAASPAEMDEDEMRMRTAEELRKSRGVDFDTGAFYQEAFQNPWADYVEPVKTPSFLGDLLRQMLIFFRGHQSCDSKMEDPRGLVFKRRWEPCAPTTDL